ncbi:HAD family hydrolase [Streptomyces nigrescens]|uniref:Haloacid dehalogenase-like hydrolase n=1 Tax=Streptomyces nigrescens TaxID=1920 RepID=A0ABY7J125_STRNI|nr:haloacid dehalogenase-like hydrolase [Streptomyces nigrescens]WAU04002.1 haloacid dehalogenase-like hydrolase [Streptomyces nigrescens]
MTETPSALVLWDIDRTLLYVGNIDRQVYREAFFEVVGRPAERLPARGTGVTMPLAIRSLLRENGVPASEVPNLLPRIAELLPRRLADHMADLRSEGVLMPGAVAALRAMRAHIGLVPTVLTGNLKPNAILKLEAFELDQFVDVEIGGYASDNDNRPALVAISQNRAQAKHGTTFDRSNTVIIGDSLEDVRTGLQGGAAVIAVASGTTPAAALQRAGADVVLDGLTDIQRLMNALSELFSPSERL